MFATGSLAAPRSCSILEPCALCSWGERPDLEDFLARRRALGHDPHDEVREGDYHVAPDPHPDHGIVQEILVAHPQERWVRCYDLQADRSVAVARSRVLDVSMAEVFSAIDWP